jgi:hypothetical protein
MDSEWSYELRKTPDGGYAIAVHHYRHLTRMVSTSEEKEFETLLDAVNWLRDTLHA